MTLADEVREFVIATLVKPAKRRGDKTVTVTALVIHKSMGIQGNRMPLVCSAIDADKFANEAGITLITRTGPAQSTIATWAFAV